MDVDDDMRIQRLASTAAGVRQERDEAIQWSTGSDEVNGQVIGKTRCFADVIVTLGKLSPKLWACSCADRKNLFIRGHGMRNCMDWGVVSRDDVMLGRLPILLTLGVLASAAMTAGEELKTARRVWCFVYP